MLEDKLFKHWGKVAIACTLWIVASFVVSACGLLDVFVEQVQAEVEDNPVIVEHIGTIDSLEIDWTATGNEPGEDVFVFRIKGSKGQGLLTAECITVDADHENVASGRLELISGETYDLFPGR